MRVIGCSLFLVELIRKTGYGLDSLLFSFMLRNLRVVVPLSVVLAGGVLSCSDFPTGTDLPTEDIKIEDISIVPGQVVLSALGARDSLIVQAIYNGGRIVKGATSRWSSSAPDVVSVHPSSGVITAQRNGTAIITAVLDTDSTASAHAEVVVQQKAVSLVPFSNTIFSAPAGRDVEVAVVAKDSLGSPVADVGVHFVVTEGDGRIAPSIVRTDSAGIARAALTLGASKSVVVASMGEIATQYTVTATTLEIEFLTSSPAFPVVVGATLPRIEVQVKDNQGRVQANIPVFWEAVSGSITNADTTTNDYGIARVDWTLGLKSGTPQRLRAYIGQGAEPRDTAELVITPVSDKAAVIKPVSEGYSTASPGENVALQVKVLDQYNNPVVDEEVIWEVLSGGGGFQAKTTRTNNNGIAENTWTVGATYGSYTARARTSSSDILPASFQVNVTHGVPAQVRFLTSPPEPAKVVGTTIQRIEVLVTDANGYYTPDVSVFWEAIDGTLSNTDSRTDNDGIARADWTLGTTAGVEQRLRVRIGQGLEPRDTAVLTVVAKHGDAASIVASKQSHTTAPVGSQVSVTASVLDQFGNRVYNSPARFNVRTGGGSISPQETHTNEQGEVTATWTLGLVLGNQEVEAVIPSSGSAAVFSVNAIPGAPTSIEAVTSQTLTDVVGRTVSPVPAVLVRDAGSNVVPNAEVVWIANNGSYANGQVSARSKTDASGVATVSWTLGTQAGSASLVAAIEGDTVVFTATARADAPYRVRHISPTYTLVGVVGEKADEPLVARVEDQYGNPISNIAVTWVGNGSVVGLGTTDSNGLVSGGWTFDTIPGNQLVRPQASGLISTGEARALVTHGPAAEIRCPMGYPYCDGLEISGVAGQSLPSPLTVRVVDQYGNPVQGATILWSTNGGMLSSQFAITNADGTASVSWAMPLVVDSETVITTFAAVQGTELVYRWDARVRPGSDS